MRRLIAFWNHWVSRNIQQLFKWKKYVIFDIYICFLSSCHKLVFSFFFGLSQVDMDALMHMTDDDLKAMLIPMVSYL